jgi:hypothetical protein
MRLRVRSPAASARAMKVMIVSSSPKNADLAHQIGRCPRDRENTQRSWAKQPRNQKREDAAKIRGEQRDEICPRAALQFRAMIDGCSALEGPGRRDRTQHCLGGRHGIW